MKYGDNGELSAEIIVMLGLPLKTDQLNEISRIVMHHDLIL